MAALQSPEDAMLDMKKRKKMMRLNNAAANNSVQPPPEQPAEPRGMVNLANCEIGNSPNLQPKVMKPYKYSPLQHARQTELRKVQKSKK